MNEQPDLGGDAVARAAQATAAALTIAEGLIRLRAQRASGRATVSMPATAQVGIGPGQLAEPHVATSDRGAVQAPAFERTSPVRVIVGEAYPVPIGETVTAAAGSPSARAPAAALPAPAASAAPHR